MISDVATVLSHLGMDSPRGHWNWCGHRFILRICIKVVRLEWCVPSACLLTLFYHIDFFSKQANPSSLMYGRKPMLLS
jgi:hypothetical protein